MVTKVEGGLLVNNGLYTVPSLSTEVLSEVNLWSYKSLSHVQAPLQADRATPGIPGVSESSVHLAVMAS